MGQDFLDAVSTSLFSPGLAYLRYHSICKAKLAIKYNLNTNSNAFFIIKDGSNGNPYFHIDPWSFCSFD